MIIRNVMFVAGFVALFVGLWWERPSLALIVAGIVGVVLPIVAMFLAPRRQKQ